MRYINGFAFLALVVSSEARVAAHISTTGILTY